MDFMPQSAEVFIGPQKCFVCRSTVGRSMNDAMAILTHPSSQALPHWRFSSGDFNDRLQGGREGCVMELALAFRCMV